MHLFNKLAWRRKVQRSPGSCGNLFLQKQQNFLRCSTCRIIVAKAHPDNQISLAGLPNNQGSRQLFTLCLLQTSNQLEPCKMLLTIIERIKSARGYCKRCERISTQVGRLHTGVGLQGTPMHLFKAYVHPYFSDFKINKSEELLRNFNKNYLIPKLFSLFCLKNP